MSKTILQWHPATKRPSLKATKLSVTLPAGRGMSHTEKIDTSESAPILMRIAESATRGTADFKQEPNPRAGQFYYAVGQFRRYEDGEEGFESDRGQTFSPDEWAYLPNVADYRLG